MEDLGLREDVLSPDAKTEPGDSSPESKRRRLMSDSSSSHTEEPETFGSPEPPIPMPVPDVKKEDESHGIVMPTAPKEEMGDGDAEKAGTSSGGKGEEAGFEGEGDKGAGLGDEPPKDEKTKEQLAEEERQRMQVLVASFSEEQLNRYEMYRRSSFPKAAIKRTVTSDENTGQQRAVSLGQQPIMTSPVLSQVGGIAAVPQPVQSQAGQGQPSVPQQSVGQQGNALPGTSLAANPNAALQQALSALQPLLLQSGAQPTLGLPGVQPAIGLPGTQPTFGLPINQMFQTPPTVPLLPIQQLLPGLTSPYQPSPSTTVFVLPQPLATQAQPVAETQTPHVRHQHKNCCPGCVAEIQELRRLVDLIIRANANTITPGLSGTNIGTNITPLLLQQHTSPTIKSTSIPDNTIPTVQRIIQNPAVFASSPSFSEQAQIPLTGQEMSKPPPLTSKAVQERTGLLPGCHTEWHEGDESLEPQEVDEKPVPTSSILMRQEDVARPSTSHHSLRYEPLWKSKRGKNTMEMIQSRLEPDPLNPSQYVVKEEVLAMLRQKSDDRQFIARRLANLLFTKQERKISNCHGRRHKRPLDPVRLDAIKRAVFRINPTTPENMELAWKQCCASIDMSSRSACRNIKQP